MAIDFVFESGNELAQVVARPGVTRARKFYMFMKDLERAFGACAGNRQKSNDEPQPAIFHLGKFRKNIAICKSWGS